MIKMHSYGKSCSSLIAVLIAITISCKKNQASVTNDVIFKQFFAGDLANKKIAVFGNSTVASATEFFLDLSAYSQMGKALYGLPNNPTTYFSASGYINHIGSIYNEGHDGYDLGTMLQNGMVDSLVARKYDLIIVRGPIINDVRLGNVGLDSAKVLIKSLLLRIHIKLPNSCILLMTENSLLSNDKKGFIVSIPVTEKAVDGSASGIENIGKHTISILSTPTSFLNGGSVYINKGLLDEELVNISNLSNNSFAANFTKLHLRGFTVTATLESASQAYTTILRQALLPFSKTYSNLAFLDLQQLEYGINALPSNPLMLDALHPNVDGQKAEAKIVGDYISAGQ